jgi:hypothetical protein
MAMRKVALTAAGVALLLGLMGVTSIAAAPRAVEPSATSSTTLKFDVVFSPFSFIPVNPVRNPNSPFAVGDELTFHDTLLSGGKQVGDELGSCVIVELSPVLANCTDVIRLAGGNITAQFANAPPPQKDLALTGGTGIYNAVGGDGTLTEFGNGTGSMTLHVLRFPVKGGGA